MVGMLIVETAFIRVRIHVRGSDRGANGPAFELKRHACFLHSDSLQHSVYLIPL